MSIINKNQAERNQLYWVADNTIADHFPKAASALRDPDGLLAIGGDLSPERLLDAYQHGIFPWYSSGQPILWWSPDPRCVLEPNELKISRSLQKTLRKGLFKVSFNQAFEEVISACAQPRKNEGTTWITEEMNNAYTELHHQGHALSVECWYEGELVGGLYGVTIGKIYFGESMFSRMPDASKVALVHLVQELKNREFRLIDCQVYSRHLQNLGAKPIPRELFINILQHYCKPSMEYNWPQVSCLP